MGEQWHGLTCLVAGCAFRVYGEASAVNKFCAGHRREHTQREWEQCPRCASDALEGSSLEVDGIFVYQTVDCTACDASWTETYVASGHSEYEDGSRG